MNLKDIYRMVFRLNVESMQFRNESAGLYRKLIFETSFKLSKKSFFFIKCDIHRHLKLDLNSIIIK